MVLCRSKDKTKTTMIGATVVAALLLVLVLFYVARHAFLAPEGADVASWDVFERDAEPGDVLVTKSYDVGALLSSMGQAGYFSHASAIVKDPDGSKWVLDASPFRSRRRFPLEEIRRGKVGSEVYWLRARQPPKPSRINRATQKLEDLSDCKRTPWNFFNGMTCSGIVASYLNEIGVLPNPHRRDSSVFPMDFVRTLKPVFKNPVRILKL